MNKIFFLLSLLPIFLLSCYAYATTEQIQNKKWGIRLRDQKNRAISQQTRPISHQGRPKILNLRNRNNWQRNRWQDNTRGRDKWQRDSWQENWQDSWQDDWEQENKKEKNNWEERNSQKERNSWKEKDGRKKKYSKRERGDGREKKSKFFHHGPKHSNCERCLKKVKRELEKVSMEAKEANCKIGYLLSVIESVICQLENCDPLDQFEAIQSQLLVLESSLTSSLSTDCSGFESIESKLNSINEEIVILDAAVGDLLDCSPCSQFATLNEQILNLGTTVNIVANADLSLQLAPSFESIQSQLLELSGALDLSSLSSCSGFDLIESKLDEINEEVESLESVINEEIANLGSTINTEITNLGTTINGEITSLEFMLNTEVTSLGATLNGEITSLESTINTEITNLGTTINADIASLESTVENLESTVNEEITSLVSTVNTLATAVSLLHVPLV